MSEPLHLVYRLSGVARPVDPHYPTNKAVLILLPLALVFGAVWALRGGAGPGDATLAGVNAALLLFIGWATTRELSPDDNPAAFLAVALALAAWTRVGQQSILIPATILMAVRLVDRSTGKATERGDLVVLPLMFAALAWFVSWTCGVIGALALILDALLPVAGEQPRRREHLGVAVPVVLVTVARLLVGFETPRLPAHLPVFASIAAAGLLVGLLYPQPRSIGDVDLAPLQRIRVRAGLLLGVLAVVLASVDGGLDLRALAGAWACVLATVLGLPLMLLRRRERRAPRNGPSVPGVRGP